MSGDVGEAVKEWSPCLGYPPAERRKGKEAGAGHDDSVPDGLLLALGKPLVGS